MATMRPSSSRKRRKHSAGLGEYCEAEFWTQVAECLRDLHAIKFAGAGKVLGNIDERQASQIANYRSGSAPRTMGGPSPNSNS
ncbi:hypothetical protein [Sphingopyxis sp. PET50]|uniref:hypothetical protein n=1 Tax=Sphingopyxis sp. PET50 TaxID=2976533 RepID=UPI0021AF14C1|nr:hypothetical protein [Sphingopyxis sp. PET50]